MNEAYRRRPRGRSESVRQREGARVLGVSPCAQGPYRRQADRSGSVFDRAAAIAAPEEAAGGLPRAASSGGCRDALSAVRVRAEAAARRVPVARRIRMRGAGDPVARRGVGPDAERVQAESARLRLFGRISRGFGDVVIETLGIC